jgi:predicted ribosome quality control (RQC) complex YloA/Tae2 family protein
VFASSDFLDTPTLAPTVFQPKKQLTMPPQKRSKKNTPAETDQEEHHHVEGNRISLIPEPSNITDKERRAKLEALQGASAEKTAHIQEQPTEQQTHENDDDDKTIDKELERVQQKIQQLQKEKEKFANQLQAKRKASEKVEKLNRAKEQIEAIQREIKEMQEQENISLWQDSPHQDSGRYRGTPRVMESHNSWILSRHYP